MEKKFKKINTAFGQQCFACGPENVHGLKMEFYTDEESLFSDINIPEHLCGWDNLIHGGVISTILDEIMAWTGIYLLKKVVVTKSMNVEFLKPLYITDKLKAEGKIFQINKRTEGVMHGFIFNQKGDLCAKATGYYALFNMDTIKRIKIISEEGLNVVKNFVE